MGGDLMQEVVKIVEDYQLAEQIIHEAAMEFEEELDWEDNDERDYYIELGNFEDELLEKLKKEYDYTPDEDEAEDYTEEPDTEDTEKTFIEKCNDFALAAQKFAEDIALR
jgi:hypothetical protein